MNCQFTLKRISSNWAGTMGVLLDNEEPFALTVEPPWYNNQVNVSCIPSMEYRCKFIISNNFGPTFLIEEVPGRTACVFHKGNFGFNLWSKKIKSATKGCIVIGERFDRLKGYPAVLSSRAGFKEFLKRTENLTEFNLRIENHTDHVVNF